MQILGINPTKGVAMLDLAGRIDAINFLRDEKGTVKIIATNKTHVKHAQTIIKAIMQWYKEADTDIQEMTVTK